MKTRCLTVLAAGLLAAVPLTAEPPAREANPDARTAQLIRDLDSPRFAVRERAARELKALEAKALLALKEALRAPPSAEFEQRARALVRELAIHEPGGPVVNGLKVRLLVDRDTLRTGQTVKLTTILGNMTDGPLNVCVGFTTCGNYFTAGSTVRDVVPSGKTAKEVAPRWLVGFCGTGAGPMFLTLPPKGTQTYETPVTVMQKDGKTYLALGANRFTALDTAGRVHTLRMVLEVTPAHNRDVGFGKGSGVRPTNEQAPYWSGSVRSNDITLTVIP